MAAKAKPAKPATKRTPSLDSVVYDLECARTATWLLDELHLGGELGHLVDGGPGWTRDDNEVVHVPPSEEDKARAYWLTRMMIAALAERLDSATGDVREMLTHRSAAAPKPAVV
jgi:hypothetical protein